jgi:hypothetical protein
MIPGHIDSPSRVIGYFSYSDRRNVLCDGDACIIAGSEELMKSYLQRISKDNKKDIIRKTRFGEILDGLKQGGAYAFDAQSYNRFLHLSKINGMTGLPEKDTFLDMPSENMRFVRIQIAP